MSLGEALRPRPRRSRPDAEEGGERFGLVDPGNGGSPLRPRPSRHSHHSMRRRGPATECHGFFGRLLLASPSARVGREKGTRCPRDGPKSRWIPFPSVSLRPGKDGSDRGCFRGPFAAATTGERKTRRLPPGSVGLSSPASAGVPVGEIGDAIASSRGSLSAAAVGEPGIDAGAGSDVASSSGTPRAGEAAEGGLARSAGHPPGRGSRRARTFGASLVAATGLPSRRSPPSGGVSPSQCRTARLFPCSRVAAGGRFGRGGGKEGCSRRRAPSPPADTRGGCRRSRTGEAPVDRPAFRRRCGHGGGRGLRAVVPSGAASRSAACRRRGREACSLHEEAAR